ncbi:HIT-like protein [Hypoxylon trugodes]|uniref:HIT-like protein n=1 Tax=Hypoxylon trugodes TaxID=326681 RepID=UPI0021A03EF4|nr:HIT-like protein [Hypoxylon trugodes]KAI1390694.1 HIT-like protein [Hypoxylon trugodes]
MQRMRAIFSYLAHLEWTEKKQKDCIFCDRTKFQGNIVYETDTLFAINNISKAGTYHWLIMPKEHQWRDVESLVYEDTQLLQSMIDLKKELLQKHCPAVSPKNIHSGFHRGRRVLFRDVYWPDIISIHHLHMHVIVEPRFWLWLFKYPSWLPLMWKSEKQIEQELKRKSAER